MSFAEVLQELPSLTFRQRQTLVRRALNLDDPDLSPADQILVEKRLAAHHKNLSSSLPLEKVKSRLRAQFKK